MNTFTVPRYNTPFFTDIANQLVYNQEKLVSFINRPFSIQNFKDQIGEKATYFNHEKRNTLVKVLEEQYSGLDENCPVFRNIQLLKKQNTFTITTGHQLNIFTGPLYVILKILNVINLAEQLHIEYPECHFVPVHWLASEDHDFDEVNHTYLFGKKVLWDEYQGGSMGKYDLINWHELKNQLHQFFQNQPDSLVHTIIDSFEGENLAKATKNIIHFLFEKNGLVVLDADHHALKTEFATTMKKEVTDSFVVKEVANTNNNLIQQGIKPQAFARPINLFYTQKGLRNRLIPNENGQISIAGIGTFSKKEMLEMIDANPARFSPNVLMRPLYQETILPNLVYVGGGGEMAYWLQLKNVFQVANIPYPLIQVRVSTQIFDNKIIQKWKNLGFETKEIFESEMKLKKQFVDRNESSNGKIDQISNDYQNLATSLRALAKEKENESLVSYIESEIVKIGKQMDTIFGKLEKNKKQRHEVSLKQIEDIIKKVFPEQGLIERKENFFGLLNNQDPFYCIDLLKNNLNPFEKDLLCIQW
jgi:bacillithiol biosynthesis cysteine-adding enzyme BshC